MHYDLLSKDLYKRYWPFVRGIHRSLPAQRPVTRSFDVSFDLRLNKRLSKQSWGWWFETPSCPLWCHCNVWNLPCFKAIPKTSTRISRYRDFTRSCIKISVRLVNPGPMSPVFGCINRDTHMLNQHHAEIFDNGTNVFLHNISWFLLHKHRITIELVMTDSFF